MTTPVRLQLSRRKGFNLQAHSLAVNGLAAVNVARPSKWGNTWKIGSNMFDRLLDDFRPCETAADCVQAFRQSVDWDPNAKSTFVTPHPDGEVTVLEVWGGYGPEHRNRKTAKAELAGKNLACWCSLEPGTPCHADVLLELANK